MLRSISAKEGDPPTPKSTRQVILFNSPHSGPVQLTLTGFMGWGVGGGSPMSLPSCSTSGVINQSNLPPVEAVSNYRPFHPSSSRHQTSGLLLLLCNYQLIAEMNFLKARFKHQSAPSSASSPSPWGNYTQGSCAQQSKALTKCGPGRSICPFVVFHYHTLKCL